MIENIENLKTELEHLLFKSRDVLAKTHVPSEKSGTTETVSRLLPIGARRGNGERGRFKPDSRIGEVGDISRSVPRLVPELVSTAGSDARDIGARAHGKRYARLRLSDSGDFPTTGNGSDEAVHVLKQRKLVDVVGHQHVCTIEVRKAVITRVAVRVRKDIGQAGAVVAGTRQGIGDTELQVTGKAVLNADLQPVVTRDPGILGYVHDAHPEIGTQVVGVNTWICV